MAVRDLAQRTIALDSQIPFGDTTNGCDGRASASDLLALAAAEVSGAMVTQPVAPNLTGFIVTVTPIATGQSMWLQLAPTAAFAAGNVILPPVANCVDGQEVLVTSTQTITALTVSGNGATSLFGAPTTMGPSTPWRMRFDGVLKSWFLVA